MIFMQNVFKHIIVKSHSLEYVHLTPQQPRLAAPMIVMLHEGLGSVSMWRNFPQRLADATGCEALAYSRAGYGWSDPVPPYTVNYMHHEGVVVLPELLKILEIERPVLFGHSDGGSIALLCAGGGGISLRGAVVLAPHVLVEDVTVAGIAATCELYRNTDFRSRLGKYHADVDSVFRHWYEIWLDPAFRSWNIEEYLPRITCPILAIQGENDEYATMTQIDRIAAAATGEVGLLKLAQCGHVPHKDQPQAVLNATTAFIDRLCDI